MDIKYFYVSFDPYVDIFVVNFYTDLFPNGIEINVGLPLNEAGDGYLEGEELHKFIMAQAPRRQLMEKERIALLDTSYIDSLFANQKV